MAKLRYEKFIGATAEEAMQRLQVALTDGSFPVRHGMGPDMGIWMTHQEVVPGVMQAPTFVVHVTAWVDVP